MAWEEGGGMVKTVNTAMDTAMREILGANGGLLTGFVGLITMLDENGQQKYVVLESDEQTFTQSLGMSTLLDINFRHIINTQLKES